MDLDFWHGKWERREIGFHEGKPHELLVRHFDRLHPARGSHIFVPLCGKTADIPWLLDLGHRVSGVEVNQIAVEEFFSELNLEPAITAVGPVTSYCAPGVTIYLGDLFDLSANVLGTVDAVYDRAALVAMPGEMRARYACHMVSITAAAPQLLISYEYEAGSMKGPPFSVDECEIRRLYALDYSILLLDRLPGRSLKSARHANEAVWRLGRPNK